ncbi:hypothetical protein [Rhodovulum marinum]|uniref:Uncharacterized protein n=1 Tax=Rhodovulum marinum TaxID=320662 RepID=A0A4R2PS80_9RHOB|nr:hypothetical protein [Rhodovulum marinum]TCP38709.1 hypothetical protein EV662_11810 [Rhodovulum marinum]
MDSRTTVIGGLVVVAAFGYYLSQQRSGSEEAALEGQVGALTQRIGELEASLAAATEKAEAQAAVIAETAALGSRLAETVQGIGEISETAGTAQSTEPAGAAAAMETIAAAPKAEEPAEPAATAAAEGGTGVGETAILADGAIRAFVSRVDEAGQTARLSINGALSEVAAGDTIAVAADGQDCSVSVDAIGGGTVSLSASCTAAEAEPAAEEPGSGSAAAAAAEGTMVGVGETALFGGSEVRVFVSRVTADAAVIAVNGLATTTLAVGGSIPVGDACNVALAGVEGNAAALGYACAS